MSDWRMRYEIAESVKNLRRSRKDTTWLALMCALVAMDIPDWLALFFAAMAVVALLIAAWAQWVIIEGERLLSEDG